MLRVLSSSRVATIGTNVLRVTALPSGVAPVQSSSLIHIQNYDQLNLQRQQVRYNWQIFLTRKLDRTSGSGAAATYKYQDWDHLVRGIQEPTKMNHQGSGKDITLMQRHLNSKRHIKPTEMNRRRNQRKIFNRTVKRLDDLTRYIKYIQDNQE